MSSTSILPDKEFIKVDEVAKIFRVTVKTVYNWCDFGIFEPVKVGGVIRIKREQIIELIKKRHD